MRQRPEPTRAECVDDLVCGLLATQAIAHARGKHLARKTIERYVAEIIRYCDETHVPPAQGIGTSLTTNAGILRWHSKPVGHVDLDGSAA